MRTTNRQSRARLEWVHAAVVGAGPAGLAVSSALARARVHHVVLERGRIASSWRSQRWDSFRLNGPNWFSRVPGDCLEGSPASFATAPELVAALERFAQALPVREHVEARRAERAGPVWRLETSRGTVVAAALVVASGFQNVPRRPEFADSLPAHVTQLHTADYRRADELPGSVLVVGGGQSGLQIADDLLDAGKRVYLATSRVGRMPRRYRGRDAFEWMRDTDQLDLPVENADPAVIDAAPPQISGAAGGRTLSYQYLVRRGATLLGRVRGVDERGLELDPEIGANVWFADEASRRFKAAWDKHPSAADGDSTPDPADEPDERLYRLNGPDSLDLVAAGIGTMIWATGFSPSIGWLPTGALDSGMRPQLPGLHAVGAPWLTHRSSANLYGMWTDAERIARTITGEQLAAVA
jgi:putative flavoprotein involved in K+ transport